MNWTAVVLVVALPVVVLIAWAMWLVFATIIAKWHGPQGLESVKHVSDGFRPREWALLIPRQVLSNMFTAWNSIKSGALSASRDSGDPKRLDVEQGQAGIERYEHRGPVDDLR